MYILYDCPQTGGVFVRAGLEEAGPPYRRVDVDIRKGANFEPDYARLNPRLQVPTLVVPERGVLTEGVAIMTYIADAHPEARLLPADPWERAQAMRWLLFFATNVYEGESRKLHPGRYTSDPNGAAALGDAAVAFVNRQYEIFEAAIERAPYFFGDDLSLVDLYVWMLAQWHGDTAWLRRNCPKTVSLIEAVMARPKIAPIHAQNFTPDIGLSPSPS